MINLFESGINQVFGTNWNAPNFPNVVEMAGDALRKYVKNDNGDPVELPTALKVQYQLDNAKFGKNFFRGLPEWLTTAEALEAVNKGQPYIQPKEMEGIHATNPVSKWFQENVQTPIQAGAVAIQKSGWW